jgi:hypothetical protein
VELGRNARMLASQPMDRIATGRIVSITQMLSEHHEHHSDVNSLRALFLVGSYF